MAILMLSYANTLVFMWKALFFLILQVWCLHTRCEMRHFYTLRCPAPFWLIQCKPYRNWFIIAKVIDKSLGARFLWPTVYIFCSIHLALATHYRCHLLLYCISQRCGVIVNNNFTLAFILRTFWSLLTINFIALHDLKHWWLHLNKHIVVSAS